MTVAIVTAPDILVTMRARERWIERVDGRATLASAGATITSHAEAIRAASGFGCCCVKLACGARLIIDGLNVVTVLGRGVFPRRSPLTLNGGLDDDR